jgi:phosphinothricin acetyltransferase
LAGELPTIRAATRADLDAVLAIINDAILATTAWYEYAPWDDARVTAWLDDKQAAGWPVLVASARDGTLAGFGALGPFRTRPAYRFCAEHSVYVAKDRRGQGFGRALLAALVDAARAQGLHTLIGGVDSENLGSLAFHRAQGFVEAGRLRDVGWKFDRWLTLIFMQKML